MIKCFKDMPIWQEALHIAEEIHALTEHLPRKEDYGFTSQIRRAALSISANIAEAFGRHHTADKINFYYFARGSITEALSHIEYGARVGYIAISDQQKLNDILNRLHHDLNKVITTLRSQNNISQPKP